MNARLRYTAQLVKWPYLLFEERPQTSEQWALWCSQIDQPYDRRWCNHRAAGIV